VHSDLKALVEANPRGRKAIAAYGFLGLVVSFLEIWSVFSIQSYFIEAVADHQGVYYDVLLMVCVFLISTILSSILLFSCTYSAYRGAASLIDVILLKSNPANFHLISRDLTRLLIVERDRFAREVLTHIYIIVCRISQPILLTFFLFIKYGAIAPFSLLAIVVFYIFSAYVFASAFGQNATILASLSESIARKSEDIVRSAKVRLLIGHFSLSQSLKGELIKAARSEGVINFVSQAPRSMLDVIMIFFIASVVLWGNTSVIVDFSALVLLAPVISRVATSSQQLYKSYASIKSNSQTVKFLSTILQSLKTNQNDDNCVLAKLKPQSQDPDFVAHLSIELLRYDGTFKVHHEGCLKVESRGSPIRFISVSGPSGLGKTTAFEKALGFFSPESFQPPLFVKLLGVNADSIGYIPQNPSYLPDVDLSIINNVDRADLLLAKDALKIADFFRSDAYAYSTGEMFRLALFRELARGARLIVVDESLSSVNTEMLNSIINLVRAGKIPPLIVISHMSDINDKSDFRVMLS
jgi:ABC-type Mn2+/Zn2+ transport system ATPase subunit